MQRHVQGGRGAAQAASKGIVSFAVEFGGNVGAVGGVNRALGFVAELQKIANVRRYGSVRLSLGALAGAAGNLALGLFTSSPEDYRGPFIAFMSQGALDIGGAIVVSFALPDLRFGGVAIPVSAGEEVSIAVGGGYTFIFACKVPHTFMVDTVSGDLVCWLQWFLVRID